MADHQDVDYPIEEYMAFQRREWIAERIGWSLLLLIVVVAATGVLAFGPLSRASISDASGRLSVEYERFERVTVTTRFKFRLVSSGQPLELRLGPAFASAFQIDSVQPAPVRSTHGNDGLVLVFDPPKAGGLTVVIWCRPRRIGFTEFSVAIGAEPPLRRSILIYP
jgi:hypothetical protein